MLWLGILLLTLLSLLVTSLPLWRDGHRGEAAGAAVLLFAVAFGGYLSIGSPNLQVESPAMAGDAADVEELVQQLADRLEQAPDDIQGWTMLGRAYMMMGRFHKAADAFREVVERKQQPAPQDFLNYAEALVLADPSSLEGQAAELLDRVLEQAPDDPRALWYGGLAAEAAGDTGLAVHRWQRLLQNDLPPSFRQIAEDRLLGVAPDALDVKLTVTVDVAAGVEADIPQQGTLFVTLRRPDAAAGTPPLAARQLPSFRYPVDVRIRARDIFQGDALPQEPLTVLARITTTDDALRTRGGLQGSAEWDGESATIHVTIDRRTQ